ncbi:MAG: menaquinone biosynthesis protein [Bacteroidia bacterium]
MKEQSIRISVVSYLNSKPFLRGLNSTTDSATFMVSTDIPSVCAQKLLDDQTDIGLIPVAMIPRLKEAHIISDFCIAADGKVESVLLVSQHPLEDIRQVIMDTESRTSVMLAKILCRNHWHIQPAFISQQPGHDFSKPETIASAVIIGDKALQHRHRYNYVYDLAEAWKEYTGLPFVFAAWVSNKVIAPTRIAQLNKIFETGIQEIPQLSIELANEYPYADVQHYLQRNIRFVLSTQERKGLQLFLDQLKKFEAEESGPVIAAVDIK